MKSNFFVFLIALGFVACDYEYNYEYHIENGFEPSLHKDVLVFFRDSSYALNARNSVLIYAHSGGASGKGHYPEDIRYRELLPYWELDSIALYVNDSLVKLNLAKKEYWEFDSHERTGIYKMKITEELLEL